MKIQIPHLILITFLLVSGTAKLAGQKVLLIEKAGNPKTEKIQLYDQLTFQLKGDDHGWYTRQILDLNPDGQFILLGNDWLPLADIDRIKLKRQRTWVNIVSGALFVGGGSMVLGDIWFTLRGTPYYSEGGIEFGLINMAVAAGLHFLLAPIKYKMGGKHRLRIVDLTY